MRYPGIGVHAAILNQPCRYENGKSRNMYLSAMGAYKDSSHLAQSVKDGERQLMSAANRAKYFASLQKCEFQIHSIFRSLDIY